VAGANAQEIWQLRQSLPYEQFRSVVKQQFLGEAG
jgi:hypothetical protein